jgi:hypothetical protein
LPLIKEIYQAKRLTTKTRKEQESTNTKRLHTDFTDLELIATDKRDLSGKEINHQNTKRARDFSPLRHVEH